MGSENAHIAFLPPFLRHNVSDCFAGEHSFRYGKSSIQPSNMIMHALLYCVQRIEAWWSHLKRSFTTWGIDLFHVRERQ